MKEFGGWYLPGNENHLVDWMKAVGQVVDGRHAYQYSKLEAALSYVKRFRHVVDIGAHVGLWSYYLAPKFERLTAFEPITLHRVLWRRNVLHENTELVCVALGDKPGAVTLHTGTGSSGDTYVKEGGEHAAEMRTLDSFGLTEVDLIKIDCEGFERFIIAGGEQTIRECKPVIIVEQKPNKGRQFGITDTAAVDLLKGWGADVQKVISGDYILTF